MKKILINSKSSEETRIATLENGKLIDLDIENINREQKKANIYKGYISRIEPSLNAIFVNYGEEKNGFLPFKEVSEYYLKDIPNDDNIAPLLSEGQELIVQIDKEERGDKGAALTTFITLAGSYMVLLPNNPNGGGISRRVEGSEREKLKKYLQDLNITKNMSVIARTACVECSFEELKHDFDTLVELWSSIYKTYHHIKKPSLLHKESDIIVRTVRDHLKEDVKEIIVDFKECYQDLKRQLGLLRQSFDINKVKLYNEDLPLFAHFGIDQQIENAYKREIRLASGGSIIIDTTEALVAIDVNSSRSNKAEDVETTAFKTNLEASEEVARQLRIRDLGGLVVVDFIDMSFYPNRKQVEEKLMDSLQQDKARIQMSRISKLGLVEISRQRLSASINESVMQKCPRCEGHGFIKTTQASALTILRKIRAESMKDDTNEIRVQVPVDIAAYILNEKRDSIIDIEKISNIRILIIPNFNMESPKFQMQRIWGSSYKSNRLSSNLIENIDIMEIPKAGKKKIAAVDLSKIFDKEVPNKTKSENKPNINEQNNIKKTKAHTKKQSFFAKIANIFSNNSEKQIKDNKETKNSNSYQKTPNNNNKNNDNHLLDQKNKHRKNKAQDKYQKPQKDNNERKNYNDNKSHELNKNKRKNDIFDKKQNNKNNNNKNNNNNNNNISLNNAEDVINITKIKYSNQISEKKVDNVKKIISHNPDELVSVMVQDILNNYDTLKDDGSKKIKTEGKIKTQKYLRFHTLLVDDEIKKILEDKKSQEKTQKVKDSKGNKNFSKKEEKINKKSENKEPKKKINEDKTSPTKEKIDMQNSQSLHQYEYMKYCPSINSEYQTLI